MDEWLPELSYLFVNNDEARSISKATTAEQALASLASKTEFPIVKTGDEGVLIKSHGAAKPVPTIKVQPVDTTGAGDSFDAGFLFATLEKKMDPVAACEFANAAAARSCTFVGGVNARSSYEDVLRFKSERQSAPGLK